MTFVSWYKGLFLVGKIFINTHILQNPFLVGIPSIRVSRGVQDVPLYIHAWKPSKAMSNPSKVYLSLSTSFRHLLIPSMHSGRLIQVLLHPSALRWNYRLYGVVVYECTSKVVRFIRTVSFASCERVYQIFKITLIINLETYSIHTKDRKIIVIVFNFCGLNHMKIG